MCGDGRSGTSVKDDWGCNVCLPMSTQCRGCVDFPCTETICTVKGVSVDFPSRGEEGGGGGGGHISLCQHTVESSGRSRLGRLCPAASAQAHLPAFQHGAAARQWENCALRLQRPRGNHGAGRRTPGDLASSSPRHPPPSSSSSWPPCLGFLPTAPR